MTSPIDIFSSTSLVYPFYLELFNWQAEDPGNSALATTYLPIREIEVGDLIV